MQSGGLPFVAVVQAADFGSHHDAAGRLDGACRRSILAKREVRPRPLVVRNVGPKDLTKMPFIEDDDVVQTLAADRAEDAFDVGSRRPSQNNRSDRRTVGFGRARRHAANCCRSARFSNTRLRCRFARMIRSRTIWMMRTSMVQHSRLGLCG